MNTQAETVTGNHMRSAGSGLLVHMHTKIQMRRSLAVTCVQQALVHLRQIPVKSEVGVAQVVNAAAAGAAVMTIEEAFACSMSKTLQSCDSRRLRSWNACHTHATATGCLSGGKQERMPKPSRMVLRLHGAGGVCLGSQPVTRNFRFSNRGYGAPRGLRLHGVGMILQEGRLAVGELFPKEFYRHQIFAHRAVLKLHGVGEVHQNEEFFAGDTKWGAPASPACAGSGISAFVVQSSSLFHLTHRAVLELHGVGEVHQESQLFGGRPPGGVRQHRGHGRPRRGLLPQHRTDQVGRLAARAQPIQREAALQPRRKIVKWKPVERDDDTLICARSPS